MKRIVPAGLIIVLSALLLPVELPAADFEIQQKGLIRELYSSGDYFSAIGETRRYLHSGGDIRNRGSYEFFILGNYFLGGQYRTVIHTLAEDGKLTGARERILLSQAYMKLGYHVMGYRAVKDLPYNDAGIGGAWDLLMRKMEPLLLGNDYETALHELAAAKPYVIEEKYVRLYASLVKSRDLGYRSPPLAAAMSLVLPGAGQVYSRNFMSGAITLLGVAATAAGGWYFLKKGEKGTGFSLFFFSGLFYAGGVMSAWNSAEKYNIEADRGFVLDMKRKFIPPYGPVTGRDLKELFN